MLNIFARVKYFCLLSVRGVSDAVRAPADAGLVPADPGHAAAVAALLHQGGAGVTSNTVSPSLSCRSNAGVRTCRHLPARSSSDGRGEGSGRVLHHPVCRHLPEDRHEDRHLRDPATGGQLRKLVEINSMITGSSDTADVADPDQGQRDGVCERHHVLQGEGSYLCRL